MHLGRVDLYMSTCLTLNGLTRAWHRYKFLEEILFCISMKTWSNGSIIQK